MAETIVQSVEFERNNIEIERKLMPVFPEHLDDFRQEALPIEQYYLSHPSEDFSLRLREIMQPDGSLSYTATLKDRGSLTDHGIQRLEVEVDVAPGLYTYYKSDDLPILRKLRFDANQHVAVDYFDDGTVLCEAEDPIAWQSFTENLAVPMADITGDRQADNEWRAHLAYRRANQGAEALAPQPDLDPQQIAHDIWRQVQTDGTAIVRIGGRSGSGKSTIITQINQQLDTLGLERNVISTDDYHRGTTWLDRYKGSSWTEWDAPIVYDTATMAEDMTRLLSGESISQRYFDFADAEPKITGLLEPAPVLIIEGIYALSPDIAVEGSIDYTMPTPLATCIGRRLMRDMRDRPEFADPQASLKYMLEQAEPAYRRQPQSR